VTQPKMKCQHNPEHKHNLKMQHKLPPKQKLETTTRKGNNYRTHRKAKRGGKEKTHNTQEK